MKPTEEISAVCYDEINLSEKADCDLKYDLYIPPYKEANIFFVRSFTNQLLKIAEVEEMDNENIATEGKEAL